SHQDELLLATVKVALPPPGIAPADLPDPHSRGAEVLNGYCTQCHALPSPAMHAASDWPGVVRRMWLRVERLPASEHVEAASIGDRVTLLNYLMANALKVSGTTLPAGAGRETYSFYCSRCHALPDPKVHAAQDWQAVVMRMERNIERMNVTPMPADTLGRILEYLQGPAAGR
ncbi:MAG TPA: hypothetical protein VNH46_04210, partial [Gemmatimonadales bacterium]|nr:hypothetical protein [Gemmatimonadales bacterium]